MADGCGSFEFDPEPYSLYTFRISEITMTTPMRKGAEEARSQLPELLTAAQHGRQTIITRHGRPVAILAPISAHAEPEAQRSLLPLAGSGRGLYGHDSRAALRRLRDEWNR
jgi:prevent-host-death family protein